MPLSLSAQPSFLISYILKTLSALSIALVTLCLYRNGMGEKPLQAMLLIAMPTIVASLLLKQDGIQTWLLNDISVVSFFILYISMIVKMVNVKFSSLWIPLLTVPVSCVFYLTGGLKAMVLCVIALLTILTVAKEKNVFKESGVALGAIISIFIVMVMLFSYIATKNESMMARVYEFVSPSKYQRTAYLWNSVKNAPLFTYDTTNKFIANVGTYYGCTYGHLMMIFGNIPIMLFMLIQLCGVFMMIWRSFKLKKNFNQLAALVCSVTIGVQLMFSIGSTFLRTPINEFGTPFVTIVGVEYCVIPIILYGFMVYYDDKKIVKKKETKPLHMHIMNFIGMYDD